MFGREQRYEEGESSSSSSSSERRPQEAETSARRRYDRYGYQGAAGASASGIGRRCDRYQQRLPVDASFAGAEGSGRFDLHEHRLQHEASSNSRIGRRRYDPESSTEASYGRNGGRRSDGYDHPSLVEASSSQGGRARGSGVGQRALGDHSPTMPSDFTPADSISHDLEQRLTLQRPVPPFPIRSQASSYGTPTAVPSSPGVYIPPQRRNQTSRPPLTLLTRSIASGNRRESTEVEIHMPQVTARTEPQMSPASLQVATFASRPGYGTMGKKCRITANHFSVELADRNIHHYHVSTVFSETSVWWMFRTLALKTYEVSYS